RAAVIAGDRDEALAGLAAVASGEPAVNVVAGQAGAGRVVLVFSGQGSQWAGMGLGLAACSPVFAQALRECAQALTPRVSWSLTEVLADEQALERVDVVQPALWAVMVSLARWWAAHGVRPSAVVGHSQGEIAAACVAGALSLADAARVVAVRSRALVGLCGGMVSVALPVAEVRPRLGGLSVAAVNGARQVGVSGDSDAVDPLLAECAGDGVRARRIPVGYAAHSAQVDRVQADLLAQLADIRPARARIPMWSTVTGGWVDGSGLDGGYWFANLRRTVEFDDAVRRLDGDGFGPFVECAPHPVLAPAMADTGVGVVESLRPADAGPARRLHPPPHACTTPA